jgi:cytoplasmic iron level regulating protein YaaA (DUF328/UPF0246 family)
VLILLPPSEGKAPAGLTGDALDLATLAHPALKPARGKLITELVALCRSARSANRAQQILGLSDGLRGELAVNAALRTAPTRPAADLYTGVLYDALDLGTLPQPARERANQNILIFSALWGAVRMTDRIPPYRCSIGVSLPRAGGLATYWKPLLAKALPKSELVLDLRSSAYAPMWTPTGPSLIVRVLHERDLDGTPRRSVVSHFNKATKGRIVRDLLRAGPLPDAPEALIQALRDLRYTVEYQAPVAAGRPWRVDVVVREL